MKKKIISIIFTLMLIAVGSGIAMTALVDTVNAADDYPSKFENAEEDSIIDEWNFYNIER